MNSYKLILFIISIMMLSFLYSDYAKLPSDNTSPLSAIKNKKNNSNDNNARKLKNKNHKEINRAKNLNKEKAINNKELKEELMALENEFKIEKAELRNSYKKRRHAIYEKYGVTPPDNKRGDSNKATKLKEKF